RPTYPYTTLFRSPDAAAPDETSTVAAALGILVDPVALDLLDLSQELDVDAVLVDDIPGGVRGRDGHSAELLDLLDGVDRDVPGAGDTHPVPRDGGAARRGQRVAED